jgi:hypothetical protein
MPVTTREPSAAESSSQLSWPGENIVIKILLVVFFLLHVLAGALLQGPAPTGAASAAEEARIRLHD